MQGRIQDNCFIPKKFRLWIKKIYFLIPYCYKYLPIYGYFQYLYCMHRGIYYKIIVQANTLNGDWLVLLFLKFNYKINV